MAVKDGNHLLLPILYNLNYNEQIETKEITTTVDEIVDPLPSWNDGATKQAILAYVQDVTNTESSNFIPVSERIATFDNDGNLWSEQPAYFQFFFAIDRIKALADVHPEWKTTQPYQSVLENDMKTLMSFGEHGLMEIVMASHRC